MWNMAFVLLSVSSPDYEAHWDDLRREREHEGERCQHLDQNHPAWTLGLSMDLRDWAQLETKVRQDNTITVESTYTSTFTFTTLNTMIFALEF